LRDINGQELAVTESRVVKLKICDILGSSIQTEHCFNVGDWVTKPVLSAGKAAKCGIQTHFGTNGGPSFVMFGGKRVELHMVMNSYYIKAKILRNGQICPIEDSTPSGAHGNGDAFSNESIENQQVVADIPPPGGSGVPQSDMDPHVAWQDSHSYAKSKATAGLHPNSRIVDMQNRLREFGAPTYGSKDMVFLRLMRLEKDGKKELQTAAALRARHERQLAEGQPYVAKCLPVPDPPSDMERFTHELTHLPFAPWCQWCQMGKGQDRPHHMVHPSEKSEVPKVEMDFMFMDKENRKCSKEEANVTILTCVDESTGVPLALVVPGKGVDNKYALSSVLDYLKRLGHSEIRLRTDGEPAIKALSDLIVKERSPLKTQQETTPRYSAASLGLMGVTQKFIQGQIRTLLAELESRYDFLLMEIMLCGPGLCVIVHGLLRGFM